MAAGLTGPAQTGILALCEEVDGLSQQLSEMCRRGQGDTPQAQAVARYVPVRKRNVVNELLWSSG